MHIYEIFILGKIRGHQTFNMIFFETFPKFLWKKKKTNNLTKEAKKAIKTTKGYSQPDYFWYNNQIFWKAFFSSTPSSL